MEEQLRKADERLDDLLEKSLKLEMAVQRLTEHEGIDRPKYEEWHKDVLGRLIELEKVRRELEVTALRDIADSEKERIIRRRVDEIVNAGLHEYLDELQNKMNQLGAGIHETFFAFKTRESSKKQAKAVREPAQ